MNKLESGDVVQIYPSDSISKMYQGLFAVVEKVFASGLQVYIPTVGTDEEVGGLIYLNLFYHQVERVGSAPWVADDTERTDAEDIEYSTDTNTPSSSTDQD